ncbi:S-adenosyl-L-methionine-dependent methyltransferase [Dentipellis sp. KUC8613]|nr:S-adenosyl-L-methionine-dependent methyltransferase [Dentipellis sp. KUC8613]
MSLRLRAAPVDLSDDGDTSGSESTDNAGEEETWSDWVSDSAQKCQSLFEPKTFPSVADALAFDRDTHGFDLEAVCKRLSLDFLQRARLINYIRKQKLSPKDLQSLNGQEPFLSEDEYLQPVIEDDPLLREPKLATSDDWSDSDDENAPSDLTSAKRRIDLLEKKLQEAQRDLADYKGLVSNRLDIGSLRDAISEPGPSGAGSSARDDDTHYFESYGANDIHAVMIQDRVRTSTYASFIMTNPSLFRDAVVMDVGCGTGILSLFAAKAGAKRVIAVDASDIAQKAKRIVKANGFEDVITVIQGKVEQISLPDGITEVDVIISEWMGYALLYESMLDSVLHARDRFLKPGGVMAPSECKMNLVLCEGSEIYKERIGFWNDVYGSTGFDLSAMGEEVDEEAIVDVVGPDTVLSEPCTVKDLIIRDITTRQLDFTAPFTLVSTAERRTKIHSFVLYFDTFFSPTGDPVPEGTEVTVRKDGAGAVAEVWHVGGRPHIPRRPSQNVKEKDRITSFSTGPASEPTHWKHTIFLLEEPIVVDEGTVVSGTFHCKKSEENSRELDVELHYAVRENKDAPVPEEVVVQLYKVR